MGRFNLFHLVVILIGLALIFLFRGPAESEVSFFGFAESNETTVNYNYPVLIDSILVRPGQAVFAGDPLLLVSRRKAKESLADQTYRIAQLRAEEQLWQQGKRAELSELAQGLDGEVAETEERLLAARRELTYKRSLAEGLQSVTAEPSDYRPLEMKIARLDSELARRREMAGVKESSLREELRLGANPYREQIRRLEAEMEFEEDQRVQPLVVSAPIDGLVGNIEVREEEHVPSYATLLTFYEPHSNLVRGYVHEQQTASVGLNDELEVYSLTEVDNTYPGKVVGLGSRIVETPRRLRKLADFETYGREVIVEIPAGNTFLQKEKVGVRRKMDGDE